MRLIYSLIEAEEERQKRKIYKPENYGVMDWLAFLIEEVGELSQGITAIRYRGSQDHNNVVRQAVQVAALAIRIAERYGAYEVEDEG